MPANLSQQYRNAEKKYRRAATLEEELECLLLMLREIPKHKGTDKLQAELKKKISQARSRLQNQPTRKSSPGFRMPRQGAGRVVIVGAPNSGKSLLYNVLTESSADVAEFPFTTTAPQPALMSYEDVNIQVVDTPPITQGNFDPHIEALIRGADLVLLTIDLASDEGLEGFFHCIRTIQNSRTRLQKTAGLDETDIGVTYSTTFRVFTQSDCAGASERKELFDEFRAEQGVADEFEEFVVSAVAGNGLDKLKNAVFESLDLVRIHTKDPAQKEPDLADPYTLARGSTVIDLAELIHEELARNFHSARVWGEGKHDGTVVFADYELSDKDIVEIKTR